MRGRIANERFDSKIKASWYHPNDPFEFVAVDYQRTVSQFHVNKILKSLQEQQEKGMTPHFKEPLVVNVRTNKKVALLDGYHRWEAMRKFGMNVKLKIEIYEDLNHDEEKELYEAYNIGKKHTTLDIIRPNIDKNKALAYLEKNSRIPLTRYVNRARGISLSSFLNSYKQQQPHEKGKSVPLGDYIMNEFGFEDAEKIVKWAAWYVDTIGEYHPKSDFYHRNFISVAMHIYWNTLRLDVYETRLSKFIFDAEIRQILNTSSGFTGFKVLLPVVKARINKLLKRPIIL